MSLDVIKTWKDMEDIRDTLKKRDDVLITINREVFALFNPQNIFKATGDFLTTEFEEAVFFNGHYQTASQYNESSLPDGAIRYVYKGYDVDFFGVDENFISRLNPKIVIAGGPNNPTPDTSSFYIGRGDRAFSKYEHYTTYANDSTHITMSVAFFSTLELFQTTLDVATADGKTFGNQPANVFMFNNNHPTGHVSLYTKLILSLHNTREFV